MPESSKLRSTRFYGILDTGYVSKEDWLAKLRALAKGGSGIIQVRAKKESDTERARLLDLAYQTLQALPKAQRPLLVINDDLKLAIKYPDVGLHIGQDDTPPEEARAQLGPSRILGLSTHSIAQAQAAMDLPGGTLDYFAVGPVFSTQTKPDYTPVGLELVSWVAAQKPKLPFFCIGGIDRKNVSQVIEAGTKRIVAVSDALVTDDTAEAVQEFISILQ